MTMTQTAVASSGAAQSHSLSYPVAIAVMAAGRSTRMQGFNKLLALFDGKPLVRRSVSRALAARPEQVLLVTGHMAGRLVKVVSDMEVEIVHNPLFETGFASSLKAAMRAVPAQCAGLMIHLADMPFIREDDLRRLIDAFQTTKGQAIIRATCAGEPRNPVIIPRSIFPMISSLEGDQGAREILNASPRELVKIEIGQSASADVDTLEALKQAGGVAPTEC